MQFVSPPVEKACATKLHTTKYVKKPIPNELQWNAKHYYLRLLAGWLSKHLENCWMADYTNIGKIGK